MRNIAVILVAVLLCGIVHGQESQRQRLEHHIYTLASDSLRGREAGTVDAQRAAEYITAQWQQMGLKPFLGNSYSIPFRTGGTDYNNLVAIIEGSDTVLKDELIVVGGHYDHLGVRGDKVYNGADDNASGTSCVTEVARQLLANQSQMKRSVIICAFDAEEKGLYGSKALVNRLEEMGIIGKVKLMLSVDMVGWYKANGKLILEGTGTLANSKELLSPTALGIDIKIMSKPFENSILTATDTGPFAEAGIPTLAVCTGLKSPYHKPEDDADLIDYEGLDRITDYIAALTLRASDRDGKLASGRLSRKHHTKPFEVGVAVGYNSCNLNFPDATITGKSSLGFNGGLMLQYNINRVLSIHTDLLYCNTRCPLPADDDAYGRGFTLQQQSLMVPVKLQLGISESGTGFYVGLGGYYGHVFDGRFQGSVPASVPAYTSNDDHYGIVWNFGLRLGGNWHVDGTWYYQLNNTFPTSGGLPKARKDTYMVTLGYYF